MIKYFKSKLVCVLSKIVYPTVQLVWEATIKYELSELVGTRLQKDYTMM